MFSVLLITFSPYISVLSSWQEGICTTRAHLLTQPLVLLISSTLLQRAPGLLTCAACSSAAKEASADKVKLDELIVLINKFLHRREMQLPG